MRLLSAFIILTALAVAAALPTLAAGPNPGDPPPCGSCPSSVTWPKLPLACLPHRAERWNTESEMQPCHCPPQSYCPEPVHLTPADIMFVVTNNNTGVTMTIEGTEVPGLEAILVPGKPVGDLAAFLPVLDPVIRQKFHIPARQNNGVFNFAIHIVLKKTDALKDWFENTLKIPVPLAIHCCDSPCPAGLYPEVEKMEVEVTKIVGEGAGNPADCDKFTKLLKEAEEQRDKDKKDAEDAAKKAKEACEEPTGAPGAACDKALKDAKDADDKAKDSQKKVDEMFTAKTNACKFPTTIKEKLVIDVLQCKGDTSLTIVLPREGCVLEGTQITLTDGTTKKVEELKVGDVVKGNEGAAKIIASTRFTQQKDNFYSINGGEAFFTVEHPILTKAGWKSVDPKITSTKGSKTKILGKLAVGDKVLTKDGEVEVKSIEKKTIEGGVSAYNLKVEGDGSFIANGVVLKGFNQMQMHY